MKIISTKVHGVLDYIEGVALILAPYIFGFSDVGGAAVALPQVLGIGLIAYSLVTNYEMGLFKVLSMRGHLTLDFVAGALLAISPWLFGFADEESNAWLPHLIVGLGVMLAVLMTEREPRRGETTNE